jgi:eukaryotic-like serine/threonine-protein kinase
MTETDDRRAHWERVLDSTALEVAARSLGDEPGGDLVGTQVGPYLVESWIGSGGMGDVYRARDCNLDRLVALKILPAAFGQDDAWAARFKQEARVLASLNHPHIAAIHGFEAAGRHLAVALELIEGSTLADRLANGPIAVDEALSIARQVAEGLEAAHERGIVHHDLKPSNIGVRADGTAKLLDFGLATAPRADGAGPEVPAFGTPGYACPEHAAGRPADRRADIWAFGVVLYEMLAGRRPIDAGATPGGPAAVDVEALPAATPAPVVRLLERCLERDPRRRLRDIGEARIALEDAIAGNPPGEIRRRSGISGRWQWPLAVAATGAAAAIVATLWPWPPAPQRPVTATRFPLALAPDQLLAAPTPHHVVALSSDGSHLVYVGSGRLYLHRMAELGAHAISGTDVSGVLTEPAFSPDGRSIAFWSGVDQTIKTIPVAGGSPLTVCRADSPSGLSWAGDALYYGALGQGILRVPAGGGTPAVVARVGGDEQAHGPQLLPGGALIFTIATGTAQERWDHARIVVQTADGKRRTILERATDARYVATGHLVYAAADGVHAIGFDPRHLTVEGPVLSTLAGVRRSSGRRSGAAQFAVADNGSIAYVPGAVRRAGSAYAEIGADTRIVAVDRDGRVDPLPLPPGPYREVRISPDGRRLAIAADDRKEAAIFVYDRSGGRSMQRLTGGGNDRAPIWTADGRRIAFQSDRGGDPAVFWQPADGSAPAERLTTPGAGEAHEPEAWLHGGAGLLYNSRTRDEFSLWTLTADRRTAPFGDVRTSLTPSASVSPDGRWVAYVRSSPDRSGWIEVQPFPATGARYPLVVAQPPEGPVNSPHKPLWARQGTTLLYVPRLGGFEMVSATTSPGLAFGRPTAVPRPFVPGPPDARRSHDIGPDGRIVGLMSTEPTMPDELRRTTIQVVLGWLSARRP